MWNSEVPSLFFCANDLTSLPPSLILIRAFFCLKLSLSLLKLVSAPIIKLKNRLSSNLTI